MSTHYALPTGVTVGGLGSSGDDTFDVFDPTAGRTASTGGHQASSRTSTGLPNRFESHAHRDLDEWHAELAVTLSELSGARLSNRALYFVLNLSPDSPSYHSRECAWDDEV